MKALSTEFDFYNEYFTGNVQDFEKALLNNHRKCLLSIKNRRGISLETLPPYRGSHFIRDPRDLIVSGYRYHLWTQEPWCNDSNFDWTSITTHPFFLKYVTANKENVPQNISYKMYLNTLDQETGMIVELIWRQFDFHTLQHWNFNNPTIIEKKYEDIIGQETSSFREIFLHYQFHPEVIERGLEIVEQLSLKNQSKREGSHIRDGSAHQWRKEFTPLHKKLFKQLNGDLLIRLGYEQNSTW